MAEAGTVAAWLLVAGTIIGLAPVAHPSLIPVWSASRAEHIRIVGANRRAWYLLNAGFASATVATTAGLALMAAMLDADPGGRAGLIAGTVAYALGGVLWCAVLAVRARATPALADLGSERGADPAATLLEAAQGGVFGAFVLTTGVALVAIGLSLAVGGQVSIWAAASAVVVGVLAVALQVATGDLIPAVLYLPTLLIGIALLLGWT